MVYWYFIQIVASIFCVFATLRRFIQTNFKNVGLEPYETKALFQLVFSAFLIGMQFGVLLFYGFLHCWFNAFAEMLRFGDRLFYKDWWNAYSYGEFYRKWNLVVNDWIFRYVYRRLLEVKNCI